MLRPRAWRRPLGPVGERQLRMRGVAEGRGHPVPGPGPAVAHSVILGKRAVEEGRAGAVEACGGLGGGLGVVLTGLGVSGGQAVVVWRVSQLRGRGETDQGPGPAHRHAALVTERAVDSAAVVGRVVTRKGAATSIQSRIVKCHSVLSRMNEREMFIFVSDAPVIFRVASSHQSWAVGEAVPLTVRRDAHVDHWRGEVCVSAVITMLSQCLLI